MLAFISIENSATPLELRHRKPLAQIPDRATDWVGRPITPVKAGQSDEIIESIAEGVALLVRATNG